MNIYLIVILGILITEYLLELVVDTLNVRSCGDELPSEFEGSYSPERYATSQKYLKENTRFSLITGGFFGIVTILFILLGGFNVIDQWARGFGGTELISGLV